ncbi:orotate phosphoribosyltransferase [Lentimicrobium sp. S6]|uniref:orotate phosphoribosyltransferase n=1 Tax=Lentimicrobium sp. S6 TaxID=2735872 RepID=UPI001551859C|nr:orotate phosphoribosyltransferase [Lentimicrobium sp. S6]MBF8984748.1 orotate phosphoribosyltransferase [Lutibacter sp. B2]NPD47393.1 orotate phosphoribosyltransferase [Lentimicrobium sp. S6]
MQLKNDVAENVAKLLLQVKAVKLSPNQPFTWASGWNSPIYCDNRLTLSYPQIRTYIRQEFVKMISEEVGHIDIIVGVATGGIAIGALVAQELGLPFAYVRSASKAHGLTNQIEGVVESGQRAVVIEDLISTGGSSMKAVEALREVGVNVKAMIAIFNYGFEVAQKRFDDAKCRMMSLSNYDALIEFAMATDYIQKSDYASLKKWREAPDKWNK